MSDTQTPSKLFDATIWTKESLINYVHNTLNNIESVKYVFNETEDSIIWTIKYDTSIFEEPDLQNISWSNIHIDLSDKDEYVLHFNKYSGSHAFFYYVYSMFE